MNQPQPPTGGFDLHRLLYLMAGLERVLVVVCFALMTSVMLADVLAREFLGAGFYWARQTAVYADVGIAMFGMGLASADNAHLRPRFMDALVPAAWQPAMPIVQHGLMALFCAGFAAVAVVFVFGSWQINELSTVIALPVWPIQALIPAAFGMLTVRHGLYALRPDLAPADNIRPA